MSLGLLACSSLVLPRQQEEDAAIKAAIKASKQSKPKQRARKPESQVRIWRTALVCFVLASVLLGLLGRVRECVIDCDFSTSVRVAAFSTVAVLPSRNSSEQGTGLAALSHLVGSEIQLAGNRREPLL